MNTLNQTPEHPLILGLPGSIFFLDARRNCLENPYRTFPVSQREAAMSAGIKHQYRRGRFGYLTASSAKWLSGRSLNALANAISVRLIAFLLPITLFLGHTATANDQVLSKRLTPPGVAAVANAQKAIQEIFGEEIDKAKTPSARKALAAKLLQLAKDPKETMANRWVLYTLAREIAASAGAVVQAAEALDEQALAFAVTSRVELAAETAEKLAKMASVTGVGNKPILDFLYATAEQAIEADDFKTCVRMLDLGLDLAKWNLQDPVTTRKFQMRRTSAAELAKLFEDAQQDDMAVGKYLCFRKGDWAKGLPLLAKSKDAGLAAAAKKDGEQPTEAKDQTDLGNAWWDLAEIAKDQERIGLLRRAVHWYRKGVNGLGGLAKAKIESRIKKGTAELAEADAKNGFPVGTGGAAEHKPGEVIEVEIAKGVKMKFCWIPPGKATLGSPATEKERVAAKEAEHEFTTKGFWLGKYEVTQEQWEVLMGENPSWFSKNGGGKENVKGQDTSEYPVEQVSWTDCQLFLKRLNNAAKQTGALGKGEFVLPHEDEWEYACRGGKGNQQAFYFGNMLNGTQANCDGNSPYGTTTKGPCLQRTAEVGSYEKIAPHPWGLCDMHGNVWEWCENWPGGEKQMRVDRGGCRAHNSMDCRSARRAWSDPGNRDGSGGCRIAFRLD